MEENKNLVKDGTNSIFAKEFTPISKFKYFLMNIWEAVWKLIKWVLDFVLSIVLSILSFLKTVVVGIFKGAQLIGRFFKRKAHQFKYNDTAGRWSFVAFGVSSIKHGQVVNGILYLIFEIGYIVLFALFGVPAIGKLSLQNQTLPGPDPYCEDMVCPWVNGDNSTLLLIFGLLWCLSILVFLYIWNRSINAGYMNYRIQEFIKFDETYNGFKEKAAVLDTEAQECAKSHGSKSNFKKQFKYNIDKYIPAELKENKNDYNYAEYLFNGVIDGAYAYVKKLAPLNKKIKKVQARLDKAVKSEKLKVDSLNAELNKKKEVLANEQPRLNQVELENNKIAIDELCAEYGVKLDKLHNKTTATKAKLELAVKKATHKRDEVVKTYANYVEVQSSRNNDKYGKFNFYFKHVASLEGELLFYKNYKKFKEIYNKSLGGANAQNEKNKKEIETLGVTCNEKIAKTNEKFDKIYAKRSELENQIKELKIGYEAEVKQIKLEGGDEARLAEAKNKLVSETTRLANALNDLPTDKMVKALYKEEIKESKSAYKRDRKYLKTNFTDVTYAKGQVLDSMLVEYKIEYKDAVYFTEILLRKEGFMSDEEVKAKVADLEKEVSDYKEAHENHYVGKSKSFKEQITGLFNDNFHITILLLPILGIVLMTILPLIFSILIAFTNYSKGHEPPTQIFTWIGLDNFMTLFNPPADSIYHNLPDALLTTLGWTLLWAVCATFSNYILGIIVALMINKDGIKLKKLWRTVFVLTIAIPQFISLLTISSLLKPNGVIDKIVINMTGASMGFAEKGHVPLTKFLIILVNVWVGIPYTILSTTGILLNIPKDLYESSTVDGAGTFKQFTKITMPYIIFVTGPYLITQFVGNINNFNVIYFLTNGGPNLAGTALQVGETDLLITFLYELITSASNPQYGIASTVGIVIFVICAFFSIAMYNKTGAIKEEDQFQ